MRATEARPAALIVGVWVLAMLLLWLAWPRPARPSQPRYLSFRLVGTPFKTALREAGRWRLEARLAVNREHEQLEAQDGDAAEWPNWEPWRLQRLTLDRHGYLRRARSWARRAAALARTPEEVFRTSELRAMIEHEAGDHAAELREVEKMLALRPRAREAVWSLRRAARCNRRPDLARQAREELAKR